MNAPITHFRHFSKEKVLESLVWIARTWQQICHDKPLTSLYAYKILFFADKFHLNDYGIPVTGDRYRAIMKGPVPVMAQKIIKRHASLKNFEEKIDTALYIEQQEHKILTALRDPRFDIFAESNIKSLKKSLDQCKKLSAEELSYQTHKEEAWKSSKDKKNKAMDYNLFVNKDNPHREEILEALGEVAYYAVF